MCSYHIKTNDFFRCSFRATLFVVLACCTLLSNTAQAEESVELIDKTRIVGQVVHYYDGVLTLRLANGSKMKLPAHKVRSIRFKLPSPRAALSSPKKAFQRLRRAALRGDIATYIDGHSTYYQMALGHRIALGKKAEFKKQLKRQWGEIQLKIVGTKVKGGMATMRIRSSKDGKSQTGEVHFVKENGEWKMILPL
jgi:hypothetical protein